MTTPAFIIVGRVRKAHGIRGEVVVEPITDAPDAIFASGPRVFAGTASGVNNAVARAAGLLAVAALPALAGMSGDSYDNPEVFAHGFDVAIVICAGLLLASALLALLTISNNALGHAAQAPEAPHRGVA